MQKESRRNQNRRLSSLMSPPSCQGGDPANLQPDYRQVAVKLEAENVGLIKNYQPRSKHGKENQNRSVPERERRILARVFHTWLNDTKNTVKFDEVRVQGEAPSSAAFTSSNGLSEMPPT